MAANRQSKLLARQLFKLSLIDGRVSAEHVAGVLAWLEKNPPRHPLAVLKQYHRFVVTELAKSQALVEHAGAINDGILRLIEDALARRYRRPITAVARPNPDLLAGLRVRVGDDVFESSVAGQLAALSAAV
ncbi:MAG: hypothetical protein A3G75_09955 [Verrucomicrobia bacterium RIFCSPLOWO2_12_FULL_64_8]|nr:MAG: hypothetical protein A3G75_09955 [Verrucomicrobia bacterium RIFCSPLOWO2_12_FULL_64_8]